MSFLNPLKSQAKAVQTEQGQVKHERKEVRHPEKSALQAIELVVGEPNSFG